MPIMFVMRRTKLHILSLVRGHDDPFHMTVVFNCELTERSSKQGYIV